MKKVFLSSATCLCMAACATYTIGSADLKPMDQTSYMLTPLMVYPYKDGFFSFGQNDYLYYYEHMEKPVRICQLSYKNDKPADSVENEKLRYVENPTGGYMLVYEERLTYLSHYRNSDGEEHYNLVSLSLDGKDRVVIMEFSYEPIVFTIQRGKIFAVETDNELVSKLHGYDSSGKEIYTRKLDGVPGRLFADGEWVYFTDNIASSAVTIRINVESMQDSLVFEGDPIYFENKGQFSRSHYTYSGTAAYTDNRITDINDNVLFQCSENQIIQYFDDERIYVCDRTKDLFTYRIYDYEGNMIQEIDPSESGITALLLDIYRVIDGQILTNIMAENGLGFMTCNMDDGACRVLDEPYE